MNVEEMVIRNFIAAQNMSNACWDSIIDMCAASENKHAAILADAYRWANCFALKSVGELLNARECLDAMQSAHNGPEALPPTADEKPAVD